MLDTVSFAVGFLKSILLQTVPPDAFVVRLLGCFVEGNKWRLS